MRGDQRWTASRDQAVDPPAQLHEFDGRLVGRVLHQRHRILGQPRLGHGLAQHRHDGPVGVQGGRRPAQEGSVARFEAQPRGVTRHVGPVLVDDADDTERHPHPGDPQAVGTDPSRRSPRLPGRAGWPPCAGRPPWPRPDRGSGATGPGPPRSCPVASACSRSSALASTRARQRSSSSSAATTQCVVTYRARRAGHHPRRAADAVRQQLESGRGHRISVQGPGRPDGRRPGVAFPSTRPPGRRTSGPGPWRTRHRRARRSPRHRRDGSPRGRR